jgi:hypothetical protein
MKGGKQKEWGKKNKKKKNRDREKNDNIRTIREREKKKKKTRKKKTNKPHFPHFFPEIASPNANKSHNSKKTPRYELFFLENPLFGRKI